MSKLSELQSRQDDIQEQCDKARAASDVAGEQLKKAEIGLELSEVTERALGAARKLDDDAQSDLAFVERRLAAVAEACAIQAQRDETEASELQMMISSRVRERAEHEYLKAIDTATRSLATVAAIVGAKSGKSPMTTSPLGFPELLCKGDQAELYASTAWQWLATAEKAALETTKPKLKKVS